MLSGVNVNIEKNLMTAIEMKNRKRYKMIALAISLAIHLIAVSGLIFVTQPEYQVKVKGWFSKNNAEVVSDARS